MTFLIIALLLAAVYLIAALRLRVSLFRGLFVLAMVSLFVTLHLGLNYVNSRIPDPEGIGLTSSYLHWIFGDSTWSTNRFGNAFRASSWISFALLCATAVAAFDRKRN